MTSAKINIINATLLRPDAKYLIALDQTAVSREDAAALARALQRHGIDNSIIFMVNGNPKKLVKVIEQEADDGNN